MLRLTITLRLQKPLSLIGDKVSAKGFFWFFIIVASISLLTTVSFIGGLIWRAYGTYILILLAGWIVYKIAKKIKPSTNLKT
jgi:hypothetical protein